MFKKIGAFLMCSLLLVAGSVFAQSENSITSSDIQAYRADLSRICDYLDIQLSQMNSPHGHKLVSAARRSMNSLTDEDISKAFAKSGLPDLGDVLTALSKAVSISPLEPLGLGSSSAGLPEKPPVLSNCGDIVHDAGSRLGFLSAWQGARTVLAAAEMGCLETAVVAGFGGNVALVCDFFVIALAAAEIPVDLGEFCANEETASFVEGNYDRLEHIHSDLETMRDEIISLGCEIARLLNTPQGLRASDILSCQGQPGFPYSWPNEKNDRMTMELIN